MLHVIESGAAPADTVVYLHGAGASGHVWRDQVAALPAFHSITVDLPGHGGSSRPGWTSLDAAADAVAEVLLARAGGGRAHLVASGLGADVGVRLIARHASLLRSAVLTGAAAERRPRGIRMLALGAARGRTAGVSLAGLPSAAVPTLALAGSRDSASARRSAWKVAAAIPGARSALAPGLGRDWITQDPLLFTETIDLWVNDHHIAHGLDEVAVPR